MAVSTYGSKMLKLIPFIIGILAGYLTATVFALIGNATGNPALTVIDYSALLNMSSFIALPDFTFLGADWSGVDAAYILTVFVAYVPVAFVVFAEPQHHLRRIHRLRCDHQKRLHRLHLGRGLCLHHLLADHSAGRFP